MTSGPIPVRYVIDCRSFYSPVLPYRWQSENNVSLCLRSDFGFKLLEDWKVQIEWNNCSLYSLDSVWKVFCPLPRLLIRSYPISYTATKYGTAQVADMINRDTLASCEGQIQDYATGLLSLLAPRSLWSLTPKP